MFVSQEAKWRAYGDDGGRVRVEDAADVGPRLVHARVEPEAGLVDAEERAAAVDEAAVESHLDQAARRHLVVEQPERVDQEVLVLAGHARLHEHTSTHIVARPMLNHKHKQYCTT